MLFMCTTKSYMESEQLSLIDEYLTTQEAQAAREEDDAWKAEDEPPVATSKSVQLISECVLGKGKGLKLLLISMGL